MKKKYKKSTKRVNKLTKIKPTYIIAGALAVFAIATFLLLKLTKEREAEIFLTAPQYDSPPPRPIISPPLRSAAGSFRPRISPSVSPRPRPPASSPSPSSLRKRSPSPTLRPASARPYPSPSPRL